MQSLPRVEHMFKLYARASWPVWAGAKRRSKPWQHVYLFVLNIGGFRRSFKLNSWGNKTFEMPCHTKTLRQPASTPGTQKGWVFGHQDARAQEGRWSLLLCLLRSTCSIQFDMSDVVP